MLDELVENYFAKEAELGKLEESIKLIKQDANTVKKSMVDIKHSLANLLKESKHSSFLIEIAETKYVVSLDGAGSVDINEILTAKEVKTELAVHRMKKGSKEILLEEKRVKPTQPVPTTPNSWTKQMKKMGFQERQYQTAMEQIIEALANRK